MNPSEPLDAAQVQIIETICRILRSDSDPSVKLVAAQELGKLSIITQTCVDALCQAAELDPEPEIRKQAVKSLRRIYANNTTAKQLFQLLQTIVETPNTLQITERDRLQTEWDTIHRKVAKLREARSIETGAAIQF